MIPKRTASEMMGSSENDEGGPLKRMKEMLKKNADRVILSNNETREFQGLIRNNDVKIEGHKHDIKLWEKCIEKTQKTVADLEQTNKEYKGNIEKKRQGIARLKQEEEVILAIQKEAETLEKALQKGVQRTMTRFLEQKLEKASLLIEKGNKANQDEKIANDEGKKMSKSETYGSFMQSLNRRTVRAELGFGTWGKLTSIRAICYSNEALITRIYPMFAQALIIIIHFIHGDQNIY
ncbi:hypothetical protein EAE96_007093 [Botrytis aclada]|nr:hypothetical protein EAE96_007093 [Botrytis aclada]